ncbi:MAG: hypothetical protein ACHRHE_11305 [Tepidisphaerales bacterium]
MGSVEEPALSPSCPNDHVNGYQDACTYNTGERVHVLGDHIPYNGAS